MISPWVHWLNLSDLRELTILIALNSDRDGHCSQSYFIFYCLLLFDIVLLFVDLASSFNTAFRLGGTTRCASAIINAILYAF